MESVYSQEPLTADIIFRMFRETKEILAKSSIENDRKFQETRELLAKNSLETEKMFQETDKQMKNLMKKVRESEFRWGKFVESLVEGALVKMLNKYGINVNDTAMRETTYYLEKKVEIDIVAKNGLEVVAIEVKTTLSTEDVKDFIDKLKNFKKAFPRYADNKIYGGVAFISKDSDSDVMAEKKGLIVIKATGESGKIINAKGFKAKEWK
jgi:hypothetical protein